MHLAHDADGTSIHVGDKARSRTRCGPPRVMLTLRDARRSRLRMSHRTEAQCQSGYFLKCVMLLRVR